MPTLPHRHHPQAPAPSFSSRLLQVLADLRARSSSFPNMQLLSPSPYTPQTSVSSNPSTRHISPTTSSQSHSYSLHQPGRHHLTSTPRHTRDLHSHHPPATQQQSFSPPSTPSGSHTSSHTPNHPSQLQQPQAATLQDTFSSNPRNITTFNLFKSLTHNFTLGHFNAHSLKKRLDIVKSLLLQTHLCFLGISESLFKSNESLPHITGYTARSFPHVNGYRSLAIYIRSDIFKHCSLTKHSITKHFSFVTYSVRMPNTTHFHLTLLHIHVTAKPRHISKINNLMLSLPHNIIFGDLNLEHTS